jgi:enoyl-CoA hydratase/carnithine racemase
MSPDRPCWSAGVCQLAFDISVTRDGDVAVLTVDNPPVNALHPDVGAAIEERLAALGPDTSIRCLVITGAGRHFMAGGDISFFPTLRHDRDRAERYVLGIQRMQDALATLPQPVIAAIAGAALGGGCELAMACDIRIAQQDATFGQPEVTLGLIPGAGGTQNLPRLVGPGRAKRMLFTGERLTAGEALAIGLVDELVPDGTVLEHAVALGHTIAANAPLAVTAAKRAVNIGLQMSALDGHRLEATLFASLVQSADFTEGVTAFLQKRTPSFKRK